MIVLVLLSSARIIIPVSQIKTNQSYSPITPVIKNEATSSVHLRMNNFKVKEYFPFNLTIKNSKDLYYYGQIVAGSENKTFNVLFDTGSSVSWLTTEDCKECPAQNRLSCESSTTCVQSENVGAIEYGTGYVKGYLGSDMIGLTPEFMVKSSLLWVEEGRDLENYALIDGFMGFGPSENSKDFIDTAYEAGHIEDKVFSFHLDSNIKSDGSSTNGSYLIIGYIPDNKVNNITWMPVTDSEHWATRVSGAKIGNKTVNIEMDTASKEILFDSGASLLILSRPVISELSAQLLKFDYFHTDNGSYYWPCEEENLAKYPNITFNVKGLPLNITAYSYFLFSTSITKSERKWCELAISLSQFKFQILGDAFLRNNFVVFSKRNQTIGLYTPGIAIVALSDEYDMVIFVGVAVFVMMILAACLLIKYQTKPPRSSLSNRASRTSHKSSFLTESQEEMIKNQDL